MTRSFHGAAISALGLGVVWLLAGCTQTSSASEETRPQERTTVNESLPGAQPYPETLQKTLAEALAAKGGEYEPRTEHLLPDGGPIYTNRLILEDSPYLQQHAHNPVNWYSWSSEAFEKAAREDKPIFLSIGYSTCHWCHVMERESFESVEIARILNEKFISIKLDRERRPDLDDIYMTAVQLVTGRGGWPMSSFLTPEGKPFYGGTYFPPEQFGTLLARIDEAWRTQRPQLLESASALAAAVGEATGARGKAEEVGQEALEKAITQVLSRHDARLGGFGGAPKFPHEPELLFLLDAALRDGGADVLGAVEKSLSAMAEGGIYDQVGGGFHRYSTDARWLVPHFEKMLYNQAHLSRAYLEAYQLTGRAFYSRVARQTLDYVLREMTAPGGGFYSATDADSEGEEGLFFVWKPAEVRAVLTVEDAELAIDLFGVREGGNFEGRTIMTLTRSLEEYGAEKKISAGELEGRLDGIREKLWQAREKRIPPLRDDKILTSWNGMMITAFASAAVILGDRRYLEAATDASNFLWQENRGAGKDGLGLWRVSLDGSSSVEAVHDDYAYFTEALLAVYDAGGEGIWLDRAVAVADAMLERFWDTDNGGFYMSAEPAGETPLIARPKSPTDGAIPSGNSVAVRALARLGERTGNRLYLDRASATINAFSGSLARAPSGFAYMLLGAGELLRGETGPQRYAAGGAVAARARIEATSGGGYRAVVDLRIREGWHINSHQPLQEELIPTHLTTAGEAGETGWRLADVDYPEPRRVRLAFQQEELAVYEGSARISGKLSVAGEGGPGPGRSVDLELGLQACNDEVCLRPEKIVLRVPTGPVG